MLLISEIYENENDLMNNYVQLKAMTVRKTQLL